MRQIGPSGTLTNQQGFNVAQQAAAPRIRMQSNVQQAASQGYQQAIGGMQQATGSAHQTTGEVRGAAGTMTALRMIGGASNNPVAAQQQQYRPQLTNQSGASDAGGSRHRAPVAVIAPYQCQQSSSSQGGEANESITHQQASAAGTFNSHFQTCF